MSTTPSTEIADPLAPEQLERARDELARGGNPEWVYAAEHPRHGQLVFRARLPRAKTMAANYVAVENLLGDLTAPGGADARIFAMAMAALGDGPGRLIDRPAVDRREVDDEDRGSTRIEVVYYDPDEELLPNFVLQVFLSFHAWRTQLLEPEAVRALGEAFGGTSGDASSDASSSTGESRPGTPDSTS